MHSSVALKRATQQASRATVPGTAKPAQAGVRGTLLMSVEPGSGGAGRCGAAWRRTMISQIQVGRPSSTHTTLLPA
jgi:hypothetical protein